MIPKPLYQTKTLFTALLIIVAAACFKPLTAEAQILTRYDPEELADSIQKEFDLGPYFGFYKDNYFIAGTSIGNKPTAYNSDVKFQISLGIRLTNATLPWHTYLYLFYTQKTLWNVFQNSMPMRDMNFNPGIGWAKPFFSKGRFIGKVTLMVEHESNGRDGDASRSWNKVSLAGTALVTDGLTVHAKYWIPIVDGVNNKDILKYSGIFQTGLAYTTNNKRWNFGATFIKRQGFNLNFNTILEAAWRFSKKVNLDLYAQYYNGFGECMLDYNQFHTRLRVGVVFKPQFFSEY